MPSKRVLQTSAIGKEMPVRLVWLSLKSHPPPPPFLPLLIRSSGLGIYLGLSLVMAGCCGLAIGLKLNVEEDVSSGKA